MGSFTSRGDSLFFLIIHQAPHSWGFFVSGMMGRFDSEGHSSD